MKLCQCLKTEGFTLWIDKEQMIYGATDFLMIDGITDSTIFLCCLSTAYCKGENTLNEFYYANNTKKPIVYVLIEDIQEKVERYKKLTPVSFYMGEQMFYKFKNDIDKVVTAIEKVLNVCELSPL